nr:ATP-binding protein [Nodosilinea sp. LEGE 06152]
MLEQTAGNGQDTTLFSKFGEMGERMQALDWAQTPVGPIETWSQSLKSTIRTLLSSRYPMILLWEQELIQIYNDAYINLIGAKHPHALGRSIRETQAESWTVIGPMITEVMSTGIPNWVEDQMLVVNRSGYNEEAHFSLSYSAVEDDAGVIRGMLCVCSEVTQQVLGERRLRLQRDLAARAGETRSVEATCQDILTAIADYPLDVPFALIYLRESADDASLRLCGPIRDDCYAIAPIAIAPGTAADQWSLTSVMAGQTVVIDGLSRHATIPGGPWGETVHRAIGLPIPSANVTAPLGTLVCGLSPNRALDEGYQSFFELVASQVSVSIRNAQVYEEERQRAEMLAEIDRAKTVFFSNVSHEFRTPLTLMLNPLEDVLESGNLPAAERKHIALAHRNSLRLLKLVNTLLDFSRIEAGRIQAVYEPTDLAALTTDLASVFRSAIESAGLQLIVDCSPLPEPGYVDHEMWEKIVLNLLSNAFKFTLEGKIRVSLRMGQESDRSENDPLPIHPSILLSVQDTGTGIPTTELPHLFERFYRVKGSQGRSYEGSGIGLSLVQELVKLHGGTIDVTSAVGRGTTFTVAIPTGCAHLPVEQIGGAAALASTEIKARAFVEEALRWLPEQSNQAQEEAATPGNSVPSSRHAPRPSPSRILLADDNADMRDYIKQLLSAHYSVTAVTDGVAALAAIQTSPPNLVITDVMMPGLDGFGLLKALRDNPQTREIPILLLSARAGEESRLEGLTAGADDYLTKPFSARELLARVDANLRLGQLRQEAVQRRIQNILEGITDGFFTLDHEWRYIYINQSAETLLGKRRMDLLGKTIWEEPPAVIDPSVETTIRQAVAEQTTVDSEVFNAPLDTWFEVHCYPLLEGVSIYFRDISDRKQAEAKRKQLLDSERVAREQAEQANRVKDEFLAVLSHELRSPLNPILGWSQLLRRGQLNEQKTQHALEVIERNAQTQAQLINDLLDVSRILRGKLSLNKQAVDVQAVIQAALETVQLAAEAKSIQIHTALDPDVGTVFGDAERLQQVVWNLLSNAVKFTPAGGRVEVRLEPVEPRRVGEWERGRVGAWASGSERGSVGEGTSPTHPPTHLPATSSTHYAQLTVSDTGKGIHPDFLPYVFDRFRQESMATTRQFGGLGLGLALVRHLVELHGGRVQANSPSEGQGATFTVQIPLMAQKVATDQELERSRLSTDLTNVQILVVDDEANTREFMAFLLELNGAKVVTAASADEAISVLAQFAPDILLSDIGMPQVDGYTLMRRVRSLPPKQGGQIPAIALTAYAGEIDYQQAMAAGFQKHIAKPVEPDHLIEAIAGLLSRNA